MSLKEEVKRSLRNLGFSDYNILIYETLLRDRELDARQLSTKTKVPYSRVYEILNEMIDKGYIIKMDGRPSTYVPRSPIDVLQHIHNTQEKAFQHNSDLVRETLMRIYSEKKSAHQANVTIIYGKDSNLTHLRTVIKNSIRSLHLMMKDFEMFIDGITEELKLLSLKHVKARFILPRKVKAREDIIKILEKLGQVKYLDNVPSNVILSDEKNAIFLSAGNYLESVPEDMIGISMAHAALALVGRSLFQGAWDSAE